ncbi:hypothetical protein HJC23_009506 [Cyclotella cryptica]|uniref:Glycerophosphocholine acyltransferase 1 n=1 Tax=Cyclotella cryptica TaxID=29204 RepID=A0ABD3Q517_9STRA|eukprot:CCRYP_008820-RA/>CCRYP_008820-RA protein AED:0.29 eAED:0.29 QI:189/1/1/1/0.5/0.33/3/1182/173
MEAYRRVATNEREISGGSRTSDSNDDDAPAPLRSRAERISDKLHALAWTVSASFIASYTHLFHTIFTDQRILRTLLHASIVLFSINIVLIFYLTVYLPHVKFRKLSNSKISASSSAFWDVYCPRVIPTMTACGVIGSFLLVRACYPVWGFLTPLILGWVALGAFFSLHFIPWF